MPDPTDITDTNSKPLSKKAGSVADRIIAGMGALMFGQALSILFQLVSLPSFLRVWDLETYGKWLMIFTIPSYLTMADGGLLAVSSNEVTMLHAQGKFERANAAFQSTIALVITLLLGGVAVSVAVFTLMPDSWMSPDLRFGAWILVVFTLVGLFGGLLDASFRANGRFAQGVYLGNVMRLIEFVGMLSGLFLGGTFTSTAAGMLCARTLGTGLQVGYCALRFTSLKWSVSEARWDTLKPMIQPGLGFLAFSVGNVLSLQTMTLVVGTAFSPAAAAVFNTYRTISRLAIQTTSIFGHALWAEFSKLFGRNDFVALGLLYRKSERLGCTISVVCAVLIFPVAPFVLKVWTHDKISFDAPVFACFCLATLLGSLAHVPRGLLMSTNQHVHLAHVYVVFAVLGTGVSALLGNRLGLSGAVLASLIADASLLLASWMMARALVKSLGGNSPTPLPSNSE